MPPEGEEAAQQLVDRQGEAVDVVGVTLHTNSFKAFKTILFNKSALTQVLGSVPDPYHMFFWPPGSRTGAVIYLYGSGSFHQQAKKFIKTLISTVL
jgi:hypothetical protein